MTTKDHKIGLIGLYNTQIQDANKYMQLVLLEAIRKLDVGVNPIEVERWVVKTENSWKFKPNQFNMTNNIIIIVVSICIIAIHTMYYGSISEHPYMLMVRFCLMTVIGYNIGAVINKYFNR